MADAKNEEILMYVGGNPKDKQDDKDRPEWQKKWDKIVNGEATFKELGEVITEGDIEKLRTAPIGKVTGFSKNPDKMRVLVVHIGYSPDEMESDEFKNYMKRTKTEIESLYGKDKINLGFHIPDKETPEIGCAGFAHMISADPEECAALKRRLQEQVGTIDIVDVRVSPQLAGKDYFGLGGKISTTPGPVYTENGEYELPYKFIVEHELMHTIGNVGGAHNPTIFGDGYTRNLYDSEARYILAGNHQEFVPEKADEKGKPIEGGCETMKKVLAKACPVDKNIFMVGRDGSKTKLLVVNPEKNIMNGSFTNEARAEAIKNGTYVTKLQKIAIKDKIHDFLAGENRIKSDKETTKINLVVADKTSDNDNKNEKSKLTVAVASKLKGRGT